MKFPRFIILLLLACTFLTAQTNVGLQKSAEALSSDSLYKVFTKEGFNPEKQLLDNSFSENFPYNIIIRPGILAKEDSTTKKKLIIVFPQQDVALFLENITKFINDIKNKSFPYTLELVFTANDKNRVETTNIEAAYPHFTPAGSTTYISSLETTKNTSAIIIETIEDTLFSVSSLSLLDQIVEITPGGVSSSGEKLIVSAGFFETIINSFNNADVPYFIKGQFLSLYRLGMISSNPIVSTWLASDIPAVLLSASLQNNENIFKTIDSVLNQYIDSNLLNQDTHYTLIQLFTQSFLISEQIYIIFLMLASAVILFSFYNLSFIKGAHKHIHRQEFSKTWYLIPLIILLTGFFLFVSQYLIQVLMPTQSSLTLFSLILKTTLATLLLILFSFVHYATKLPITGFIYGYILSISAFINIFIFAIIEITLIPIFITEYLIVHVSTHTRKKVPLILCTLLMLAPYLPFIVSLSNLDYVSAVQFIAHASFSMNFLFACILLPFQIMAIRILICFKLWGKRRNITKQKLIMQSVFIFILLILLCLISFFVPRFLLTQKLTSVLEQSSELVTTPIQVEISQTIRIGQNFNTLTISSTQEVLRYYIEISANVPLPVFDANYPYDILQKPFTAVFNLDEYPPEPFILTFTTKESQDTLCTITAWIKTDSGVQKTSVEYSLSGITE